ncbi:MAG: FixH family protein [Rhodocyclales bacterium]|nr:FixH family protein [Rhodocyclales bacterium]
MERAQSANASHPLPREGGRGEGRPFPDSRPWYRHHWPWILMAGPGVVVVAGIVTAWIAVTTSDGLVADDYYKQGLAVNQKLARNDAAAAMQLEARLRIAVDRIELRMVSRAGAPLPSRVRVTLAHPTRGGEDQKLLLAGEQGAYAGQLVAPGPGRWQVVIEDEANTWRLAGSVQLPDAPETLLMAAGKR